MQDLLELTTQCAQHEAESSRNSKAPPPKQGTGHRKLSDAERSTRVFKIRLPQKSRKNRAQISSHHQHALASLKATDQNLRHRARGYHQAQQQAKKDYDQATWLAESVLESQEQKASQELKNATELNATQTEFVDMKEGEQASLMARYNQRPPPGEALAAVKDAEASLNPVESFNQHKEVIERQIRALADLSIPKLFIGATPFLIGLLAVVIAAAIPQVIAGTLNPQWPQIGIWAGGMVVARSYFSWSCGLARAKAGGGRFYAAAASVGCGPHRQRQYDQPGFPEARYRSHHCKEGPKNRSAGGARPGDADGGKGDEKARCRRRGGAGGFPGQDGAARGTEKEIPDRTGAMARPKAGRGQEIIRF